MSVKNKISIPVFHGSLTGDIKEFHPCTHFGTREQAIFCAIRQAIEINRNDNKIYLYACSLEADECAIHHMSKDWHSPKVVATLYHYLIDTNRADIQAELWRKYYRDPKIAIDDPIYLKLLDENMSEKGHQVLSYDNKHEGIGVSYMALYGACVAISSVIEVSEEDVRNVFLDNQEYFSMTFGTMQKVLHFEDVFGSR